MKTVRQSLQTTPGTKKILLGGFFPRFLTLAIGVVSGIFLDQAMQQVSWRNSNLINGLHGHVNDPQGKIAWRSTSSNSVSQEDQSQKDPEDAAQREELREVEVSNESVEKARRVSLKMLLKRAARKDNQIEPNAVIVTAISEGWARPGSVLDVFLGQMQRVEELRALMRNFIIFCLDDFTFRRCLQVHSHQLCYAPEEEAKAVDFSGGELQYMGEPYKKMCWQKVVLAAKAAKLGYGVLATDIDIVWFRDPFPVFSTLYPDRDWFHSADIWHGNRNDFIGVNFNGGFYYARSTPINLKIYQAWLNVSDRFVADQEGMNGMKVELFEGKANPILEAKDVNFGILPTHLFGGLCQMICTLHELKDVVTVHMNCCFRSEQKIERMNALIQDHQVAKAVETHAVFGNATLIWNKQRYACIYEDVGCSPPW